MRLPIRIALIVFLAMLQGIAPILHAHARHDQLGSATFHFHIAALDSVAGAPRYDDDTRREPGVVIGVADEMRQDDAFTLDHGGLCAIRVRIESAHRRTVVPCVSPWRMSPARPFVLPLAQAPPPIVR